MEPDKRWPPSTAKVRENLDRRISAWPSGSAGGTRECDVEHALTGLRGRLTSRFGSAHRSGLRGARLTEGRALKIQRLSQQTCGRLKYGGSGSGHSSSYQSLRTASSGDDHCPRESSGSSFSVPRREHRERTGLRGRRVRRAHSPAPSVRTRGALPSITTTRPCTSSVACWPRSPRSSRPTWSPGTATSTSASRFATRATAAREVLQDPGPSPQQVAFRAAGAEGSQRFLGVGSGAIDDNASRSQRRVVSQAPASGWSSNFNSASNRLSPHSDGIPGSPRPMQSRHLSRKSSSARGFRSEPGEATMVRAKRLPLA